MKYIKQNHRPQLENLLLTFRRKMSQEYKKEGLNFELTFSQTELLRLIGKNEKVTMKEIAQYFDITPPSATVLVGEMEKKKLIKRKDDPKDRRIIYIVFTNKAKALFKKFSKRKETIVTKMLSGLSANDKIALERIIKIIIE